MPGRHPGLVGPLLGRRPQRGSELTNDGHSSSGKKWWLDNEERWTDRSSASRQALPGVKLTEALSASRSASRG